MTAQPPIDLEEAFFETDQVRWRRFFPWLLLSETLRLALDPRKIILAAFGVVLFVYLLRGIDQLPFAPENNASDTAPVASLTGPRALLDSSAADLSRDIPGSDASSERAWPFAGSAEAGIGQTILASSAEFLATDVVVRFPLLRMVSSSGLTGFTFYLTRLLGGLFVWAWVGGAIARITALQFAGDHPTSMVSSLRYSGRHLLASVTGPLLPVAGIFGVWFLTFIGGWIGQIPVVGPIIAGAAWCLTLLFGLIAALLFVGLCASWPLMICGIAVEGTDAFDALSRGFSYVFSRPIYVLWLLFAAFVIGVVSSHVVILVMTLADSLANQFFASSGADPKTFEGVAAYLHNFWQRVEFLFAQSYAVGYSWVAATVIYFLLRLSVDAMPIDRVYVPEDQDIDELAPLVGVPAAERREAKRSADDQVKSAAADESQTTNEDSEAESADASGKNASDEPPMGEKEPAS